MRKILFLAILVCLGYTGITQSHTKGLDLLLKENKRTQAASALTDAVASSPDGANALLTLTMMEVANEHYEQAYNYFRRFVAKTDNPYPYIYAFWSSGVFNTKAAGKEMLKYMEDLSKDPRAPSTIRAMANGNLASAAYQRN